MVVLDFCGQIVWVIGVGKGIGYVIVLVFVEVGVNVIGFDFVFDGESYLFVIEMLDVVDVDQVCEVCSWLLVNIECLDVLVNVVGILCMGVIDQLSVEDWQQIFVVNVGGVFNLFQQMMVQFCCQWGGVIVIVVFDVVYMLCIGMSVYGVLKVVLKSLVLIVGFELVGSGVCCNLVLLGFIDIDMQCILWVSDDVEQQWICGFGEQFKFGILLGKIVCLQEIVNIILFFVFFYVSYIILQDIVVDGGLMLGV